MRILKKLSILSLACLFGVTITSCSDSNKEETTNDPQALRVSLTDGSLDEASRQSMIKAQYLVKNNGYDDNDDVGIIVKLSAPSMMDYFASYGNTYDSVSEFYNSPKGVLRRTNIEQEQSKIINQLKALELIGNISQTYTTVLNGFACHTTYGNFKELENSGLVEEVILCDTYNLPSTSSADSSSSYNTVTNVVDVYETGIFNSSSSDYNGEGTSVAVLDSGFDCSHTVFANQPEKEMITLDLVNDKLKSLNAYQTTENLKAEDLYYSKKIPYAYDYADKDFDVNPFDSEHGTHVAGIIAGDDDTITGVATNTQLVLMKVFSDFSSGAETEDLVAALNDAVILGVDCINMSLGTSCGFNREVDEEAINEVYDAIEEAGISLIAAASNDYSSGYGGEAGNTNKTSNPDSGTVGAPSSYTSSLSVASINGFKSSYLVGNDFDTFFYLQSRDITSKEHNFINELSASDSELLNNKTKTYEYVTVPGSGTSASYSSIDVKGKIAVVKRGDNTFDEKAKLAKKKGAIAIIIYNNVEGDIAMTISDKDHIPAISISKEDGLKLAAKSSGTITVSTDYLAGPFMSDFSSWGPTPSLELKPEITAHGGEILSSIPGGNYDTMSGTSMATPNMCGVVVLIRQYLKEKYPEKTAKEILNLTYSLLMSTATIANNESGDPYTPRKQGAGLASLSNATNTNAYLSVEGQTKPKLELGDDKNRTGKYEMTFTINNMSNKAINYTLDLDVMTESVSTSDSDYVAEKSYMLDNSFKAYANGSEITSKKVTVPANGSITITYKYELTNEAKNYMNSNFAYGIYVEGFVKCIAEDGSEVNLNAPFLAFYGDWTEAPIFDKTYYEVESEAHNGNIDDEDKLKADYWATTPYGMYCYNYLMPLGTYVYNMSDGYTAIPATEDHIAISSTYGSIDGLSVIYAGCLRSCKSMTYTITDNVTGEVIYTIVDYNAHKAFANSGSPMPYYKYLRQTADDLGLVNNRTYTFSMVGQLDYGDGGVSTNTRNSFSFTFTMDDEAPIIKDATFESEYDETTKKTKYYVNLTVYDNHYVQSVTPVAFTSYTTEKVSYTSLTKYPVPVYGEKGSNTTVRIDITDYVGSDGAFPNTLSFNIDDYALNSNIYIIELPGTTGELSFDKTGYDAVVNEELDLLSHLTSSTYEDNSYLKYLDWTSSNPEIADVYQGIVIPYKEGRVKITCTDKMYGKSASVYVYVEESSTTKSVKRAYSGDAELNKITFDYFDTLLSYTQQGESSTIGKTGDRMFTSAATTIEMYPGEQIQLHAVFDPWYLDATNCTWSSNNTKKATVDENGIVTALDEGSTYIKLTKNGSTISASIKITVLSPFVIESRTLVSYKGLGGDVVIPDDEGILYIGEYAFSLYGTDLNIKNPDDDDDYNKTPASNTVITSVVIPEGVEDIKKYAFYNCPYLESVVLPSSIRFIREYAFSYNTSLQNADGSSYKSSLKSINLEDVEVIGASAFEGCSELTSINLKNCYAIAKYAFKGCTSLTTVDISKLRNAGVGVFMDCTNLTSYTTNNAGLTRIGEYMFYNSGLENAVIYSTQIPAYSFANCKKLKTITVNGSVVTIGNYAFSSNEQLESIVINGTVEYLNKYAISSNAKLSSVTLPNGSVKVEEYAISSNPKLVTLKFQENTYLKNISSNFISSSVIEEFIVDKNNSYYEVTNSLLTSNNNIILAAPGANYADYTIPNNITEISSGAFSGITSIYSLIIPNNIVIGAYAFANCTELTEITLQDGQVISDYAFAGCTKLVNINNLEKISKIGSYAFYKISSNEWNSSNAIELTLGDKVNLGEGAFKEAGIKVINFSGDATIGDFSFEGCKLLTTVNATNDSKLYISSNAFNGNYNLNTFDFTKVYGEIGDYAFVGCTGLTEAQLTNVLRIGDYAFAECKKLTVIYMPNVEAIGDYAFSKRDISSSASAPQFTSIELANSLTYIGQYAFYGANKLESIIIPNGIEQISPYAFASCTSLTTVNLPSSVNKISEYAFNGCTKLSTINLENVKTIGEGAFTSTSKLISVDLSKVESIGEGAFASSNLSQGLSTPNLITVGAYAFQGSRLSSISAPKLQSIGESAFYATTLTSFTLTSNIKYIGELVWYEASKLTEFNYVDSNGKTQTSGNINDYAYLDNGILYTYITPKKLRLLAVPAGKNIDTLEVKEGTSYIEIYAGNANKNIENIVLPDSLRTIGAYAFYGYTKLKCVEFKSINAPTMECYYSDVLGEISETDPGYELLQKYFNCYGYYLYYANFIDLIGTKNSIKMILPNNTDISGYDSIIYEGFFGTLDNATYSNYTAMDSYAVKYLELIEKIMNKDIYTLDDDSLISSCGLAYNNMNTDLTKFGYTEEELTKMAKCLSNAQTELREIKYKTASLEVKAIQEVIDSLDTVFTIDRLLELQNFATRLNKLTISEQNILDLTNYNLLLESYNAYLEGLDSAIDSVNGIVNSTYKTSTITTTSVAVMSIISCITVAGFCLLKKF